MCVFASSAGADSSCPLPYSTPQRPAFDSSLLPGSTMVEADHADGDVAGRALFRGDVQVIQAERALISDELSYDDNTQVGIASGNVSYWDPLLFWDGGVAEVEVAAKTARLEQGAYQILGERGYGVAGSIEVDRESNLTSLTDADYTTCEGPKPPWRFSARELVIDHDKQWGKARGVKLLVRETPVFYAPFLSFPISDERKSGFLAPVFNETDEGGFDVTQPYYWNIAPNQDATFNPRWLELRGFMWGGQYRYLSEGFGGQIDFEAMAEDRERNDDTRYSIKAQHAQSFNAGRGYADLLFQQVSDRFYFEDFGTNLGITSTSFLERRGRIDYRHNWLSWQLLVQDFQSVDPSLSAAGPFKRLPSLTFQTNLPQRFTNLNYNMSGEVVYFDRDASTIGTRIDLRPALAYSYRQPGYYVTPRVELRHTQYLLDDVVNRSDELSAADGSVSDTSIGRTLPVFSLDGGLFLERRNRIAGRRLLQTLEPRLFYVYIPEVEQDDLPIFDSGQFDFSPGQLFRVDRFAGRDRYGDANQVTAAFTTRIIDADSGNELLRGSLGQIYYFSDLNVTLPSRPRITDSTSEIVGELSVSPHPGLRMRGTFQWDPNETITNRSTLDVSYRPSPKKVLNMGYRLRRAFSSVGTVVDDQTVEQTEVSGRWPVFGNWGVLGRWNYSLQAEETLEVVGGIEHDGCCWASRLVARRFLSGIDGGFDQGVFFQVQLKGLAGIGKRTESILAQAIPGYENEF